MVLSLLNVIKAMVSLAMCDYGSVKSYKAKMLSAVSVIMNKDMIF